MTKGEGGQKSQKNDDVFYERPFFEKWKQFLWSQVWFSNKKNRRGRPYNFAFEIKNRIWSAHTIHVKAFPCLSILCVLRNNNRKVSLLWGDTLLLTRNSTPFCHESFELTFNVQIHTCSFICSRVTLKIKDQEFH